MKDKEIEEAYAAGLKQGKEEEAQRIARAITSLIPTCKDPADALYYIQQHFGAWKSFASLKE